MSQRIRARRLAQIAGLKYQQAVIHLQKLDVNWPAQRAYVDSLEKHAAAGPLALVTCECGRQRYVGQGAEPPAPPCPACGPAAPPRAVVPKTADQAPRMGSLLGLGTKIPKLASPPILKLNSTIAKLNPSIAKLSDPMGKLNDRIGKLPTLAGIDQISKSVGRLTATVPKLGLPELKLTRIDLPKLGEPKTYRWPADKLGGLLERLGVIDENTPGKRAAEVLAPLADKIRPLGAVVKAIGKSPELRAIGAVVERGSSWVKSAEGRAAFARLGEISKGVKAWEERIREPIYITVPWR